MIVPNKKGKRDFRTRDALLSQSSAFRGGPPVLTIHDEDARMRRQKKKFARKQMLALRAFGRLGDNDE